MQPQTLCMAMLLPVVLALAMGCPAQTDESATKAGRSADAPDSQPVESAVSGPDRAESPVQPVEAQTAQATPAPDDGDETTVGNDRPPDAAWQLAAFRLGMSVADARERLPHEHDIPVQELWKTEDYTGMIVIGTYAEPVRRMSSVMFYEGHVAAVIDNVRQTQAAFVERFGQLGADYGSTVGETPEFAAGRQFIYELLNAERQPDYQYMWADAQAEALFIAAFFAEDMLSTYMLINAAEYDLVAAVMAAE